LTGEKAKRRIHFTRPERSEVAMSQSARKEGSKKKDSTVNPVGDETGRPEKKKQVMGWGAVVGSIKRG